MEENALVRANAYAFFSDLFLALPDEQLVHTIRCDDLGAMLAGESVAVQNALKRYVEEVDGKNDEEVLRELSVDRTQLLRGVVDGGALPPYESLYTSAKAEDSCLSVAEAYRRAGLGVDESTHEPPEYIGCELGFMLALCEREAEARAQGDDGLAAECVAAQKSFFANHLGRWAGKYADAMVINARTSFYRGMGLLLGEFMAEESALLS